ncbi:MAG: DUF3320 domain-containing protein [Pirellulales bacterium]
MQEDKSELRSPDDERSAPSDSEQATLRVIVDVAETFNYSAWQNSVPLLRRVALDNSGGEERSSLVLRVKSAPQFTREKEWVVDRINAGEVLTLRDIDLPIDPDFLDRLDEAERGVLTFELRQKGELVGSVDHVLRVLARDEWGGLLTMAELLPAFVTPNSPALPGLLRAAAQLLTEHGHSPSLDGYQSGDPNRAFMLAASLWSAAAGRELIYANPPGSFEQTGQKVRRVETILADRLATCLDTSLLFASGLEAMGLNPVIVAVRGHCFVGVWLVAKTFKKLVERDVSELRKALAAKELLVFETTLITQRPPARFQDAKCVAEDALVEEKEQEFAAVIDVARARLAKIRPLALRGERVDAVNEEGQAGLLPLPALPGLALTSELDSNDRPQTPAGRIERWQRKLLDLSLRNRLLNFRPTQQSVPVLCPDLSLLEDRLANGCKLRLAALAEGNPLGQRDAELYKKRTQKELNLEYARTTLERDELVCIVEERELDARLTALFRKVRNDLEEGGSNTLYLAVGFLRWKPDVSDDRTYRAPLLLVPVKLQRVGASSRYTLTRHEDDVRINATMLQLLKKDFDCDVSDLENQLPMDDSGVDVPAVFNRVRQAVREIPGFEVVEEAVVSSFSFAKYLMWKDLVERVDHLQENRIVRHLIHRPDQPFPTSGSGALPQPREIDARYAPADIVHPLPADSSQLAAVMAASEGHDLVIIGPPGTGKSQTIANLISQCLAVGKTVLFVAEKTAALDVVHRRLKEHGLGDCCVELHSNKAERRKFLDQLAESWMRRSKVQADEWTTVAEQLRVRRDQLNEYARAVHAVEGNGWSAYRAMGECVRGRKVATPRLEWADNAAHEHAHYVEFETVIAELAKTFIAVAADAALSHVQAAEWSVAWEARLLRACEQLASASRAMLASVGKLFGAIQLVSLTDLSPDQLGLLYRLTAELAHPTLPTPVLLRRERLVDLSDSLRERGELLRHWSEATRALDNSLVEFCAHHGVAATVEAVEKRRRTLFRLAKEWMRPDLPPAELIFHSRWDEMTAAISDRPALLHARDEAHRALESRSFNMSLVNRIPIASLVREWRQACSSLWPLTHWKKKQVERKLQAYLRSGVRAEPELDLQLLEEFHAAGQRVQENLESLELSPTLQSQVVRDAHSLDAHIQDARRLRAELANAEFDVAVVDAAVQGNLAALTQAARRILPPGREFEAVREQLRANLAQLELPIGLQTAVEHDADALEGPVKMASTIRESLRELAGAGEQTSAALEAILSLPDATRQELAVECFRSAKVFREAWADYTRLANSTPTSRETRTVLADSELQARRVLERRALLKPWTVWIAVQAKARRLGLGMFVDALQSGELRAQDAVARFRLAYARWWLPAMVDRSRALRVFQRFLHEEAIEEFQRLDELARRAAAPRARHVAAHDLPASDQVPRKSELGLLRHQMTLKKPSKSIREMISGMPEVFTKLAPCLLMSPLSIAQYLPTHMSMFDVVVFDEASQIATWDAIGAIARGRQTIIVGDPKQLPPTNFFGRAENDEDVAELDDYEKDLESILDEVVAAGLPTNQLNWHYRSRHESLIAFSNWTYYGNQLVTFPAAESTDRGVSFRLVQEGVYDRGKSRTNRQEAESIVADLVARMQRCLASPPTQRLTYGVVTFNRQQQTLIQDLLDEALRRHPELEWFFADDRFEPTMVKNLENVQGDERDVMLFSITFGKDAAGKFPIDFGAINRSGGERRLNVAITRARRELVVYASFLPDQLRAERSAARGVHDLKAFLEYAEKGPQAILARSEVGLSGHDSPLEEAIAAALVERGWRLDAQVGVSGFRIDLGILHPDKPGAYLAGVECDGATYHRSAVARDRDKVRQQVLENLGWKIVRVWSTDWWYDSESAIERLDQTLRGILDDVRSNPPLPRPSVEGSTNAQLPDSSLPTPAPSDSPLALAPTPAAPLSPTKRIPPPPPPPAMRPSNIPSSIPAGNLATKSTLAESEAGRTVRKQPIARRLYAPVVLGDAAEKQTKFFDDDYAPTIREMALAVLASHAPIRDDVLAREVARAHGFARTGHKIKQRVMDVMPDVTSTVEEVGRFLWNGDKVEERVPFRYPTEEGERRSLDEIALPELIGLVSEHPQHASSDDPALGLAREIGLARLARAARDRLESAIETYESQEQRGGRS